jgi:hypothetical protein
MASEDERAQAIKRIQAKRAFQAHGLIYVAVNILLVVIWALTNPGGYFWPIWPLLGWGIGLAAHGWFTLGQRRITEAEIQREIERGRERPKQQG